MRWLSPGAVALVVGLLVGCAGDPTALVVELVPNPEVNTREQVDELVNRLDVVLDAEQGFVGVSSSDGDVGPFEPVDVDGDGDMELVLTRPGVQALEPFRLTPGRQGDRLIAITARGIDTGGGLAALGGEQAAFRIGEQTRVELPFNLLPERRPLKVVSMTPRNGSADIDPPPASVTIELGGDVLGSAVIGHFFLRATSFEPPIELEPQFVVSHADTGLGRVTTVRTVDCWLTPGAYEVVVDSEVCTRAGQCLDQSFFLEGRQPFEGTFTVAGEPTAPTGCSPAVVMTEACPESPCPEGYECDPTTCLPIGQEEPESVPSELSPPCDAELCGPPTNVCDDSGLCVPDCRLWGACADASLRCDSDSGLCE